MGAIKLTSQSRLQTRKRGVREAGAALVTLVTVLIQLSPAGCEAACAPAWCGTAELLTSPFCSQPYLCPASGTSLLSGPC